MFAPSWIAVLLLISYLLIAGTGFIKAPDEPRFAVAESHAHQVHHHQDRYADFDGLDLGLDELSDLNVHPNEDASVPEGHPIIKITGIDAHCLPGEPGFSFQPTYQVDELVSNYLRVAPTAVCRAVDAPPW